MTSKMGSPYSTTCTAHIAADMGGKKAVATSQCRLVVVNGMPSMNR